MSGVSGNGHEAGNDTPNHFQGWKPPAGSDICEDDLGRDEHDAVCNVEVCGETAQGRRADVSRLSRRSQIRRETH